MEDQRQHTRGAPMTRSFLACVLISLLCVCGCSSYRTHVASMIGFPIFRSTRSHAPESNHALASQAAPTDRAVAIASSGNGDKQANPVQSDNAGPSFQQAAFLQQTDLSHQVEAVSQPRSLNHQQTDTSEFATRANQQHIFDRPTNDSQTSSRRGYLNHGPLIESSEVSSSRPKTAVELALDLKAQNQIFKTEIATLKTNLNLMQRELESCRREISQLQVETQAYQRQLTESQYQTSVWQQKYLKLGESVRQSAERRQNQIVQLTKAIETLEQMIESNEKNSTRPSAKPVSRPAQPKSIEVRNSESEKPGALPKLRSPDENTSSLVP